MKDIIDSNEDFIQFCVDILTNKEYDENIKINFSALNFIVEISDTTWDGRVDYRGAKYITALQDSIFEITQLIYEKYDISKDDILVKVAVSEGCNLNDVDWKLILEWAKDMSEWKKFALLGLALFLMSGLPSKALDQYYAAEKQILEYQQQEMEEKGNQQELERRHERDKMLLTAIRNEGQKPTRVLAGLVNKDASITYDNEEAISQKQLKDMLPPSTRSGSRITYCDGEYTIKKKEYTSGEIIISMEKDDTVIKARIELSDDDKKKLLDSIHEKELSDELPFSMTLQVNVTHTDKMIKYGTIIGFDEPRKNASTPLVALVK
ncbi:MAG: hypothetical protein MR460_10865 [Bilophila wadsworthia]|uniref:hypothetical protein n=1 Tax=Bilophila wadsworthia TaxID=35833 RepID=UPI00242D0CAC|nr:hypothetical protein [Bilophila wadsworthia]MCI6540621.1 hypothetical protein [Bilophila wadsworthia]